MGETPLPPPESPPPDFRGLRFPGELEAAWREEQFALGLRHLRVNLAILAAVSLGVPELARAAFVAALLAAGFALTFQARAAAWYPRYMAAATTAALAAMAWFSVTAAVQGEPRGLERLLLAIVAVYFVLGLGVVAALAVNALGLATFALLASRAGLPAGELGHALLTLGLANVICLAGAWNLEHARRRAWLEGRRLAQNALRDGLTGIANRRRFDEHLQRAWAQCVRDRRPLALLFADIDHFKAFNDRYGHQAGDEALKAVAATLARFARRPLDLAARYGGEEFALVLYDVKRTDAERIAGEALAAVRRLGIAHAASASGAVLTISLGVACVSPAARRSWTGLVQLADQALYAAKDGGRDRAVTLEQEYEHMQTGYFRREAPGGDRPAQ